MIISVPNIDSLDDAARRFADSFLDDMADDKRESCIVALFGKMGAGKTTFIKALCRVLGSEDMVTSPSFSIVNEYADGNGRPIYHFDFYRIKNMEEVYDMGYEDYFYSGNLCLVEWPQLVEDLLPDDTIRLKIEVLDDETRQMLIKNF